jgi:hypothetical protein
MFYIYSLELTTLSVTLHDSTDYHKDASELLTDIAVSFIRSESGDKRAESAFKNNISEIDQDGYFLVRNDKTTDRIDVYQRRTVITAGYWGSTVKYQTDKIRFYSITEAQLQNISEISTPSPISQVSVSSSPVSRIQIQPLKSKHANHEAIAFNDALMKELKEKLAAIKKTKTESELAAVQTRLVDFLQTPLENISPVSITESGEVHLTAEESDDSSEDSELNWVKNPLPPVPAAPPLPVDLFEDIRQQEDIIQYIKRASLSRVQRLRRSSLSGAQRIKRVSFAEIIDKEDYSISSDSESESEVSYQYDDSSSESSSDSETSETESDSEAEYETLTITELESEEDFQVVN